MRILGFFFRLLVVAGVIGAFVYFLGGTLWLQVGTYNFRTDVEQLTRYPRNIADYTQMCQHSPQSSENSTPLGFELRFLDERNYVVEVVCTLIENSPIEIKQGSLPPLITKLPGSAGFYYPLDQKEVVTSAVRLFSINKEVGIALTGDTLTVGPDIYSVIGNFPKAECSAFGYSCCNVGSQVGQGNQLTRVVTDCATSCFPVCGTVPFVEFFNSDPPYETQTREIVMSADTLDVVFNYNISPKDIKNVHINFGDGNEQNSTYADGIFTHTYSCPGPCRIAAVISATDAAGVSSIESEETKIYIVRR